MYTAIYRFRVKLGREDDFREAWRDLTRAIYQGRGSLGSRLHRCEGEERLFLAYAQWPDRATYDASSARPSADPAAGAAMRDCLEEMLPTLLQTMTDDLLQDGPWAG